MRKRKVLAILMSLAIVATSLVGCSKKDDAKQDSAVAQKTPTIGTSQPGDNKNEEAKTEKPFAGVTLTYWVPLNASVSSSVGNLSETPWAKNIEELTGIHLEFIHPTIGSEAEQFSILTASGEYPDIIEYTWTKYSGGASAAISDGVIMSLNDVIGNTAPNLKKVLDEYPAVDKMVKTQEGDYYCFPFLRGVETPNKTLFSSGFVIRKDVLDQLGLAVPETITEWDTVLRAFKNAGFEAPFSTRKEWMKDVWSPGFDNWGDFYVQDGVVKNGLIEDSRKEFLTQLHKWYEEGLIDRDYLVADKASTQTYFTTGKSAAGYAPGSQGLGAYTTIMHDTDPNITEESIVSAVPVTSVKGQLAKFSKMNQIFDGSGSSPAITTQCKNVEAAAWLLDWMYSEEGTLAVRYGIEGVSYVMVDGEPQFTDLITNNPDGLTMDRASALYTRASSGATIQTDKYTEGNYSMQNQKDALAMWMLTDMGKYIYPPAVISTDKSEEFSNIMNNIKTFVDEMEAKFILGTESLDKWDEYVEQIKKFGIEEAIQMKQEAYDDYMSK